MEYSGRYEYSWSRENGGSGYDEGNFTRTDGQSYPKSYDYDDGYGNTESQTSVITQFIVKVLEKLFIKVHRNSLLLQNSLMIKKSLTVINILE